MSSGTSVPLPRTWRSISPRFTVSIQTEDFSTDGAAGWSRDNPNVIDARLTTPAPAESQMRRLRRRRISGDTGTSMPDLWGSLGDSTGIRFRSFNVLQSVPRS